MGRLRYDPYGQLIDSAGPQPALRYRWTGREYDAETGIYFHRSRYCDPTVGRFVQEDRAGYAGGGNLYAYVNGNVLQARDPDGQYMMEPYTMDPTRAGNCMEAGGAVVPCGASSPGWGGGGGVSRFGRFVYVWGSFTAWDMLTAFEKNSTGDIEFWDDDDGRIRAAYLEAKRGAYESGDLTAIEVLARAERIGLVIWSGSDIWERNSFSGCGMVAPCTDPAARRITVGTALDHQAVAAFTATHEAPALSVIIAHEIGHLWLGIIGGVYLSDRAIPMENMMRDARGCAIRHGHGDVRLNGGLPGC
jgi:RHS repeat-associated protein